MKNSHKFCILKKINPYMPQWIYNTRAGVIQPTVEVFINEE